MNTTTATTRTSSSKLARRVVLGLGTAGAAAALLLGSAGLAGAATPSHIPAPAAAQSTASTVGYDLFNHSAETLVYTHVTGRVAAPNEPILYNGDEQNFELPWVTSFGHSSGDAYYNVYNGGTSPIAVLDVHFDAGDPDGDTWSVTDPTTGQNVPGMSVQVTSPESHGVTYIDQDYTFVDDAAAASPQASR